MLKNGLIAVALIAVSAVPAQAGTTCRTSATGRTTCFNDDGTFSTLRTSPTGRTTIQDSDGTMTSGRSRDSLNGRNTTFTTDQGDTFTARRSLNGRSTTITDPNGNTSNCRTSLLGTATCY